MSHLVVTGYASLDYAVDLAGQAIGDRTTLIAGRDAGAWPRAGGCPTYIAAAARRAGQAATPVMWVGQGEEGAVFARAIAAQGLPTDGIATVASERSPTALMIYQADGSCICLYDPALARSEALTDGQAALIAGASHVCLSVGPPHLMAPILAAVRPGARLYWAVKNDPDAFPDALRAGLAEQADVIFCSASERALVAHTRAVVVETRGASSVAVTRDGTTRELPVTPVKTRDNTGAGDTFAGAFIAADMSGATAVEAAQAGIIAAVVLLTARKERKDR